MRHIHPLYAPADAGGAAAGAGEGAGTGEGAGNGAGAAAAGSWQAGLSDEVRTALEPKGFLSPDKTPNDLATIYLELESKIGQRGVTPPGDDATPEDLATFYRQSLPEHLRAPESGDKYDLGDFKPPDNIGWSDDVQSAALAAMAEAGLSNRQAQSVVAKYAEAQEARFAAEAAAADKAFTEAETALKTEWGNDFAKKMALADRVVAQAFGVDLDAVKQIKLANGRYLLDDAKLARGFAAIGEAWAEDGVLPAGGGGAFAASTPAGAQAAMDKIRAEAAEDPKHPYNDRKHPEHKAIHKRMMDLQAVVTPGTQA